MCAAVSITSTLSQANRAILGDPVTAAQIGARRDEATSAQDERPFEACSHHRPDFDAPLNKSVASALRGVQVPWTLAVCTLLGAALMFTRLIFGSEPPMADSDHLVGALIITVAISAMAEVGRLLRFINVALGLWLVAAPWVLEDASLFASAAGVAAGIAVIALSLPRGRRSKEHYGSWDRWVL